MRSNSTATERAAGAWIDSKLHALGLKAGRRVKLP